jgi:hypothetical protein
MRARKNPMTPLAAVVTGLLAGAVGTVCLDAVHYLKYRRAGAPAAPEALPGEPGLTGVWPGLGLAGVPGRVTDST